MKKQSKLNNHHAIDLLSELLSVRSILSGNIDGCELLVSSGAGINEQLVMGDDIVTPLKFVIMHRTFEDRNGVR